MRLTMTPKLNYTYHRAAVFVARVEARVAELARRPSVTLGFATQIRLHCTRASDSSGMSEVSPYRYVLEGELW